MQRKEKKQAVHVLVWLCVAFFSSSCWAQGFQPVQQTFTASGEQKDHSKATSFEVERRSASLATLLSNPSVVQDLELVPSQKDKLQKVASSFESQYRKLRKVATKSGGNVESLKKANEALGKLMEKKSEAMLSVLLPQQKVRLEQIRHHLAFRNRGVGTALVSGKVAKELEITSQQKKRILEIEEQLRRDVAKKVRELKEAARRKIIGTLNQTQQQKLDSLLGDEFVQKASDWKRSNDGPAEDKN